MADINVSRLSVPKTPRNKRIYGGNFQVEYNTTAPPASDAPILPNTQAAILSYDAGDFATRTVEVEFQTAFFDVPVGWIKAYRYEERSGGGFFVTDVVTYVPSLEWRTKVGFTIGIEDYESLTGVIIEYRFTERIDDEA